MSRRLAVLFLFLNLSLVSVAQSAPQTTAPPATFPDTSQEAVVIDQISNRVRYEADGTGQHVVSTVIRVQSEAAVREFGQLIFGYNSGFENLQVDYVRVRKPNGETLITPASSLQDFAPEVLKSAPMYSDYREKHVSVVGLRAGDTLEYQTTTHMTSSLVPGEFWYEHSFPKHVVVREARLEVDVPKSRDAHLRSPDRKYDTHDTADRRIYTWVVRDITPDRKPKKQLLDVTRDETKPDVQLTTFSDWQQVAHWYAKLQGKQVVVADTVKKKADELTRGVATPTEKAQRLYDFVARNIRYVSLSFGVGRYQPHTSVEVLQNGYGDCKDKHTLLSALLRAEGIQSYPVLIHHDVKLDPDVPSPAQFDHVITAARLGKDKDFTWLDSTAEVAPFGLIMYSLRNKQGLLAADDNTAGLHRTPGDSPIKNTEVLALDGKFSETGALDATVDLTATGDSDYPLRMGFRSVAQPDWERFVTLISRAWDLPGDISEIQIASLEDTSKPFHLHYRIHNDRYFTVPGRLDRAVPLPPILVPGEGEGTKPTEPIDVGPAVERTYRARLQFASNYDVQPPLPVRISRDYSEYASTYTLAKNVLEAERRLVLKVNEVPFSRKSDLESLRSVLRQDATQRMTFVISPASREALAAAAKVSDKSEDLLKAGNNALQRQDYKTASELLKRLVDQEPKHEAAWDALGRAYAGLNNHDEAIKAFQKQIEIDPYSQKAYGELGGELQQTGKNEEAIAAYRKHLELVPLDGAAHKHLGLLYASLKKDDQARPELEAAAKISPDDAEIKLALAEVYNRFGEAEKAKLLTKGVIGSGAAGNDMFSAALRDEDADPNQSARDARRTLDDIGDHFDAGDYNQLNSSIFSAMRFVALAWARIGWAAFQRQENMTAMQFLQSSWLLSRSGTVANRLARFYEAEGQHDKARHMFALAVAAGGADAQNSNAQVVKLSASPATAQQELAQAGKEFVESRSIKLPAIANAGTAQFNLLFDGSSNPERVQFVSGDESLRAADDALMKASYPVRFPDVSSIKIVHRGVLTCAASVCTLVLVPLEAVR
jgi:tetratricopeptide (TPR) repeat protein